MKRLAVFVTLVTASVCWGQMSSQKTQLPKNGWNTPTVESSFNHCTSATESQSCWISVKETAKPAKTIISNAGQTVAVDISCGGYVYNDGKANSWTYHPEWGCVQAAEYDYDGNLYSLRQYNSTGKGYYWSRRDGTKWTNLSCCFQSGRTLHGVWLGYDINGTLWKSTNFGTTVASQGWCAPAGPSAIAPEGLDKNGNAMFYVACTGGKIWQFDGTNWNQLPGSASAIAAGPHNHQIYIVAANGNVQHWNDTAWDDIVTSTPVTSLSVGSQFNIWTVGPTVNGANIYRFWEKGALLSHSYAGSVACGPGVPTAECGTFTHTLSHQISFGSHAGPVSTSKWNGNGSWGPNAQVFARPQDLWGCLLTGAPTDCQTLENEGEMSCNGGGSNSDNSPQYNWVAGLSVDVQDFSYNTGNNSGPLHVTINNYTGYWLGTASNAVHEACYINDPVPYCPAISPANIENKSTYWGGLQASAIAYDHWWRLQDDSIEGLDAPYTYHTFYIGDDIDGSVFNQVCLADPHEPDGFLYGAEPPHCGNF